MKKSLILFTFLFVLFIGSNATSANELEKDQIPNKAEIESLNHELEILVDKANQKLEKGEKNVEVSSKNFKLGFKQNNLLNKSRIGINAIGSKSYQAYILNTSGWNFSHAVSGIFSWKGKYLSAVSASADLTGPLYGKSSTTTKEGLDGNIGSTAKVARVTSKGKFKALKVFVTYHTTLMVDIYAPTKSYRIVKAKIDL